MLNAWRRAGGYIEDVIPPPQPSGIETRRFSDVAAVVDVVGNICESGDIFTRGDSDDNHAAARSLPEVRRGDLLALHNAGAYGYVMASEYNMRPRPPEVLLENGELKLARKAKSVDEIVKEFLG